MALENFGYATFPGIGSIERASYTLTHGISPGVATLEFAPQPVFPQEVGHLTFHYGAQSITIPGCKINRASYQRDENGNVYRLTLWDRRWKWMLGGEIYGHYNLKDDDEEVHDEVQPDSVKTPQQLAALCFLAMGETVFNVDALPNNVLPTVEWEGVNPAQALAELCDMFGCRPVLHLSGIVAIHRVGIGGNLPILPEIERDSGEADLPNRPDSVKVLGGPTRFQSLFLCEPVGLDTDDSVKHIDDLSYRPTGGWDFQIPGFFSGVTAGNARRRAQKTVWKWYRIHKHADNTTSLPDLGEFEPWQILLENGRVDTYIDEDGRRKARPPAVYGRWWSGMPGGNNTTPRVYSRPFRVLENKAIVAFDDYVFKYDETNGYRPADIGVEIAYSFRQMENRSFSRYFLQHFFPNPKGTGARTYRHDDIVLTMVHRYAEPVANQYDQYTNTETNLDKVIVEAGHYLSGIVTELSPPAQRETTYTGLIPIDPDGAIQSVTYSVVQGEGMTTSASVSCERNPGTRPYKERRMFEKMIEQQQRGDATVFFDIGLESWLSGQGPGLSRTRRRW